MYNDIIVVLYIMVVGGFIIMSIELDQKQGLIAGDGLLPVKMAQYAKENGFDVVCISLSNDNYKQLKKSHNRTSIINIKNMILILSHVFNR